MACIRSAPVPHAESLLVSAVGTPLGGLVPPHPLERGRFHRRTPGLIATPLPAPPAAVDSRAASVFSGPKSAQTPATTVGPLLGAGHHAPSWLPEGGKAWQWLHVRPSQPVRRVRNTRPSYLVAGSRKPKLLLAAPHGSDPAATLQTAQASGLHKVASTARPPANQKRVGDNAADTRGRLDWHRALRRILAAGGQGPRDRPDAIVPRPGRPPG